MATKSERLSDEQVASFMRAGFIVCTPGQMPRVSVDKVLSHDPIAEAIFRSHGFPSPIWIGPRNKENH